VAGGGVLLGFSRAAAAASSIAAAAAAGAYGSATASATSASLPPAWQIAAAVALLLPGLGGAALALLLRGAQASFLWYMAQLSVNPVLTKSVTAGVIGAVGDSLAQGLERAIESRSNGGGRGEPRSYDSRRGLSCLLYGLLISGPLMHLAYDFFETILPVASGAGPGSGLAAMAHVLADSVFLDSIFVATTFVVTGVMEGYNCRQLWSQLRGDYVPTLKASWVTSLGLLPIEFVCFRYLPVSLRVMAVNFIDVVWDTVISFMAHRSRGHHPHNRSEQQALLLNQPQAQSLPGDAAERVPDAARSILKPVELPQLAHA
jgi:peroxisomal membrane protein 2